MSTIPDEVAQKSDVELRRLNLDEEEVRDTAARSRATARQERLAFPPIYVLVGAYRLATDKNLYVPAWQKCKHGVVRGMVVGGIWVRAFLREQACRLADWSLLSGCFDVQRSTCICAVLFEQVRTTY